MDGGEEKTNVFAQIHGIIRVTHDAMAAVVVSHGTGSVLEGRVLGLGDCEGDALEGLDVAEGGDRPVFVCMGG